MEIFSRRVFCFRSAYLGIIVLPSAILSTDPVGDSPLPFANYLQLKIYRLTCISWSHTHWILRRLGPKIFILARVLVWVVDSFVLRREATDF